MRAGGPRSGSVANFVPRGAKSLARLGLGWRLGAARRSGRLAAAVTPAARASARLLARLRLLLAAPGGLVRDSSVCPRSGSGTWIVATGPPPRTGLGLRRRLGGGSPPFASRRGGRLLLAAAPAARAAARLLLRLRLLRPRPPRLGDRLLRDRLGLDAASALHLLGRPPPRPAPPRRPSCAAARASASRPRPRR